MLTFLVLLFPVLLLGFMLLMERVERPLSRVAPEREIEHFLDDANPAELAAFVTEGTDPAMGRFRRRMRRLRRGTSRRRPD